MSKRTIIIDTREPHEYETSHVDGAINIPPSDFLDGSFTNQLDGIDSDTPIILYCRSGARSNTCSMFLRDAGYLHVINGINEHHTRKMIDKA